MSFIKNLFSSPSGPQAPNPGATAAAQGAANVETARVNAKLNRPDTYTPFGSVIYEDIGDDRFKSTQTFSPEYQKLFDSQTQIGQGVNDAALNSLSQISQDPFSLNGVQDYQGSIDRSGFSAIDPDVGAARQRAEDAAFNKVWDRLGIQFDDEKRSMETQLSNQGITRGSEAFMREMERFDQRKNDARTQAGYSAIDAGQNLYNNQLANSLTMRQQQGSEGLSDVNMANAARQQQINDMLLQRGQPMNELAALLQGSPAIQAPQAANVAPVGVAPPDVQGAYNNQYAGQLNNFNQQQASNNAGLGGLFSLGSAAILAS